MRLLLIITSLLITPSLSFAKDNPLANINSTLGISPEAKPFANPNIKDEVIEDIIIPDIPAYVGQTAVDNITKAEQVFCYTVEKKNDDYNGYTISNLAITGFCGSINDKLKDKITTELFKTQSNLNLSEVAECSIQPRAIIRFARGVDHTDVLISNPCPSYVILYTNKLKAFNAQPMEKFISTLVKTFEDKKIDFISPTLHKQAMPIGIVENQDENAANKEAPILEELPEPQGWNKLSF